MLRFRFVRGIVGKLKALLTPLKNILMIVVPIAEGIKL